MNKGKIRDSAFKDLDLVYMLYTQLKCPTLHWLDVKVLRFLVYGLPFRLSECQLSALAQLSCAQRLEWILMQKFMERPQSLTQFRATCVAGSLRRHSVGGAGFLLSRDVNMHDKENRTPSASSGTLLSN